MIEAIEVEPFEGVNAAIDNRKMRHRLFSRRLGDQVGRQVARGLQLRRARRTEGKVSGTGSRVHIVPKALAAGRALLDMHPPDGLDLKLLAQMPKQPRQSGMLGKLLYLLRAGIGVASEGKRSGVKVAQNHCAEVGPKVGQRAQRY